MKTILVDDEMEFVSALAERLALRGIDADWVIHPEEAISKVQEQCYDLAVLDVKMPKLDGIALKDRLQKVCPQMRFIFLTGHGSREAFEAGQCAAGADCYLLKPLNLGELLSKIQEMGMKKKLEDDSE